MSRDRYPPVQRGPDGKKRCRGCGGEIPKRRQTWCSQECYEKHDPRHVFQRVWERANGKCERCGWDFKTPERVEHIQYGKTEYDRKFYRDSEIHHIVPFSEGGTTTDENLIVLCVPCHHVETKKWHQEKARRRRRENNPLPLFPDLMDCSAKTA